MSNSSENNPFNPTEDAYSWQFTATLLNIVPHAPLLLFISPFILHKLCLQRKKERLKDPYQWVRFPGHNLRCVMTLILLFLLVLETTEAIIMDADGGGCNISLHAHNAIALLATVFTLVLNEFCESSNNPKWMVSLLVYWTCVVISRSLWLTSLLIDGLTSEHIRVWLCGIVLGLSVILMLVDVHLMRKLVSTLIARFMGPIWDPSGADKTQVGPMLAPWTLLSG